MPIERYFINQPPATDFGKEDMVVNLNDPTESARRSMVAEINADPNGREALEAIHGQVWDTTELSRDFNVIGFGAPFVVVRRKADGKKGSLMFQHSPRFYFKFEPAQS